MGRRARNFTTAPTKNEQVHSVSLLIRVLLPLSFLIGRERADCNKKMIPAFLLLVISHGKDDVFNIHYVFFFTSPYLKLLVKEVL